MRGGRCAIRSLNGSACDTLPGCPLQIFIGGVQTPVNVTANGNACSGAGCTSDADCQTVGSPTAACDPR